MTIPYDDDDQREEEFENGDETQREVADDATADDIEITAEDEREEEVEQEQEIP